jgi:predicted regulator of Ras-like GTPase activity (Roadblock/LC7/MglB family)
METILRDLNAVLGVTGSFVCSEDGTVVAQMMPHHSEAQVQSTARLVQQVVRALASVGLAPSEMDLMFEQGYVLLKSLRGAILVIVCARSVNLPLLRVNARVASKKLSEMLRPREAVTTRRKKEAAVPATSPAVAVTETSFGELEAEWQRLMQQASSAQVTLRALGELATWLCCPQARHLLASPEERRVDVGALASQRDALLRLYTALGYQIASPASQAVPPSSLDFYHPQRRIASRVHLNTFSEYHTLDLIPFLTREDAPLPETALVLLRLQYVEITPRHLRELQALLLQHTLSASEEPGKIQLPVIIRLCADDWGWYKTVTMNLQRLMAFTLQTITTEDKVIIVERAARLLQAIEEAPKSPRWQERARQGESVRWYELPAASRSDQPPTGIRYGD